MTAQVISDKTSGSVSRFLRQLAKCIDDGDVVVRDYSTKTTEPRWSLDPSTETKPWSVSWFPEIELVAISMSTRQLMESLEQLSWIGKKR